MSEKGGEGATGGAPSTSSSNTSSSPTSNGTGLATKRRFDEDVEEGADGPLPLSTSLKTISSCAESHSAVNVHAISREEPGGEGPTTGELGRFRCTPLNRATLRRIFLTFGCGTAVACARGRQRETRFRRECGCDITLPFAAAVAELWPAALGPTEEDRRSKKLDDAESSVPQARSAPDGTTASLGRAAAIL